MSRSCELSSDEAKSKQNVGVYARCPASHGCPFADTWPTCISVTVYAHGVVTTLPAVIHTAMIAWLGVKPGCHAMSVVDTLQNGCCGRE